MIKKEKPIGVFYGLRESKGDNENIEFKKSYSTEARCSSFIIGTSGKGKMFRTEETKKQLMRKEGYIE